MLSLSDARTENKSRKYPWLYSFAGILAQNTGSFMNKTFGPTYIVASYVKYIESAGGRVVPIRYPLKQIANNIMFVAFTGLSLIHSKESLSPEAFLIVKAKKPQKL